MYIGILHLHQLCPHLYYCLVWACLFFFLFFCGLFFCFFGGFSVWLFVSPKWGINLDSQTHLEVRFCPRVFQPVFKKQTITVNLNMVGMLALQKGC